MTEITKTVTIYHDTTDPSNPGYAFRETYSDGRGEQSGEIEEVIRDQRVSAQDAGDRDQVELCDMALAGDEDAIEACIDALVDHDESVYVRG